MVYVGVVFPYSLLSPVRRSGLCGKDSFIMCFPFRLSAQTWLPVRPLPLVAPLKEGGLMIESLGLSVEQQVSLRTLIF